jgi:hypothetical protein
MQLPQSDSRAFDVEQFAPDVQVILSQVSVDHESNSIRRR